MSKIIELSSFGDLGYFTCLQIRGMHVVHFAQFNFLFLIPANRPPRYMLPKLGQDSALLLCAIEMTNGHAQHGTNETTRRYFYYA